MATPVDFRAAAPEPEASRPDPDRIVAGDPAQLAWNRYTDPTGQFFAGTWQGEPGAWRVRYAPHEEEFCVLLQGRARLTGDDGRVLEFAAGDAFVVPGGFSGTWENLTRVRKLYAIMTLKESP
jgi:hypothetical protein